MMPTKPGASLERAPGPDTASGGGAAPPTLHQRESLEEFFPRPTAPRAFPPGSGSGSGGSGGARGSGGSAELGAARGGADRPQPQGHDRQAAGQAAGQAVGPAPRTKKPAKPTKPAKPVKALRCAEPGHEPCGCIVAYAEGACDLCAACGGDDIPAGDVCFECPSCPR